MHGRMEHANITVVDIDRTVEFLTIAFPDWRIRGGGDMSGDDEWKGRWVHLGTDDYYVAIQDTDVVEKYDRDGIRQTGINHVGFEVDSVDDVMAKMEAAGYKGSLAEVHQFRKRLYVSDHDGITWEFIEYMSDIPAEKNQYS